MRGALLAAIALTLLGCGPASPTPNGPRATAAPAFVRKLEPGGGITRRLLVYDPDGLLLNVVVPTHVLGGIYEAWWEPVVGDPNSLRFAWLGGQCAIEPTLRITTHGETNLGIELSLDVFDGHRPALASGEVCGDAGIEYDVVLTFRRPISNFHVTASETEEAE